MRHTLPRLLAHSARRFTLLGPPFGSSSSSTSTSTSSPLPSSSSSPSTSTRTSTCTPSPRSRKNDLKPVRYHVFPTPLPYTVGLDLQNEIIERRLRNREKDGSMGHDVMLLLEHTPTYTTGRRDSSPNPDTLHPEEVKVQDVGAEFHITKRGGQVTYHGPGQLVGYPLFDLNAMETPTRCYVEYLQALLKDYASERLGIPGVLAPHPEGHVGVFASPTEKFASIGIHLRHRITSHGFAMNITSEPLKWFDLVLACGLADVKATSLHELLRPLGHSDETLPSVPQVATDLIPRFQETFDREFIPLDSGREDGHEEGLEEIRELVGEAERAAERFFEDKGPWAVEPDLSKRIM